MSQVATSWQPAGRRDALDPGDDRLGDRLDRLHQTSHSGQQVGEIGRAAILA